ncbi:MULTISPECIES: LysR family transcriptional regulator [Streptomyces]|uniref:DNA-binding transcriptional regulator, LysR family n=2 Tax=Streptomyces TaxID=1883 RepID=A0A1I6RVX0_9ACTN|nr:MULTISPECIES: LysR family transcriptional regulator [Streptomyces]QKV68315.1 LysR family transcriptional regulator [Streptomyces harbinensis]SFS68854.1 DNA-binding transcriptional regulator, LysR family [Streptomyces harbinensis]
MDTPQLDAFIAVVEAGSFTRAAARLSLSQPTVTTRIKNLEQGLGTILLERLPGGIRTTPSGAELLPYAREIVSLTRRARESVRSEGQPHGRIDVGTVETLTTYRLLPVIEYLYRRYPKVQISMHTDTTGDPRALVRDGTLDCAFLVDGVGADPADDLESRVLRPEPLVLVGGPGHLLAGRDRPGNAELRVATQIRADRATYHRQFDRAIGLDPGVSRSRVFELDSVDAAKWSVATGMGMALLPYVAVARELAEGTLARIDWTPPFAPYTQVVTRRDSGSNTALKVLLAAAAEVIGEESEVLPEPAARREPGPVAAGGPRPAPVPPQPPAVLTPAGARPPWPAPPDRPCRSPSSAIP